MTSRIPSLRRLDAVGWPAFGALAAIASAFVLWAGRGTTFSLDELVWVEGSPDLDLGGALDPYNGHLLLTTRVVYKAVLEVFGTDYLTFRLLTLAAVVGSAALLFAYVRRRLGAAAALAPVALLFFFGRDYGHLILGNGFTVMGATACGLAALLALERNDRTGDAAACAVLVLGVATYTVALPFVAGAAVLVLVRSDRWQRIWIAAIPALLYLAWWVGAHGSDNSSSSELAIENLLLLPAWAYQALSSVLGTVSGLEYRFSPTGAAAVGPLLAALAVAGLGWRIRRGSTPPTLWGVLAILFSLWALEALVANAFRTPEATRYLMPTTAILVVVGAWAAAGVRWTDHRLIALYAAAAVACAAGGVELVKAADRLRLEAAGIRTELGAIEIAGPSVDPDAALPIEAAKPAVIPYDLPSVSGRTPTASYLAVAERYGSSGLSAGEIRAQGEDERAAADSILIAALGLAVSPTSSNGERLDCQPAGAPGSAIRVSPGSEVTIEAGEAPIDVSLRRFADATAEPVGSVAGGQSSTLAVPTDTEPDPWFVSLSAPGRVCGQ